MIVLLGRTAVGKMVVATRERASLAAQRQRKVEDAVINLSNNGIRANLF